ncbi:MAG: hypothetical protein M3Q29_03100 [Chloroflexota bacterium]|nr:hypothetical protein [Chloroflexota bacterium]
MSETLPCTVSAQEAQDGEATTVAMDGYPQVFPVSGVLADNLNQNLDSLRERIGANNDVVYSYVVASIRCEREHFVQLGSAPNFQGDLITLCTCKHQMRSRLDAHSWIGKWVAGFSGRGATRDGRRYLVYLMRIRQAFKSQQELWLALAEHTRQAKSSVTQRLGDLYEPEQPPGDPFDPHSYLAPRVDHTHAAHNGWYRDIAYTGRSKRRPALLVGDARQTFLWNRPLLAASFDVPRDYTRKRLQELLRPVAGDGLR